MKEETMEWVTNPEEYWLSRGETYLHELSTRNFFERRYVRSQEQILINFLKAFDFESVLKAECGFVGSPN